MDTSKGKSQNKLVVRNLNNTEINSIRMLYGGNPTEIENADGPITNARFAAYFYDNKIETYLKNRKKRGKDDMRVHQHFHSWLWAVAAESQKFGLSVDLLAHVESGDSKAIDEMCLILMERLIERTEIEKSGTIHAQSLGKAISNGFVFHLIDAAITGSILAEKALPRSLIVLLRSIVTQSQEFQNSDRLLRNREKAVTLAVSLKAEGIETNYRNVGKIMGVEASTVFRWFKEIDVQDWDEWVEQHICHAVNSIAQYRKEDPDDSQELELSDLKPWE